MWSTAKKDIKVYVLKKLDALSPEAIYSIFNSDFKWKLGVKHKAKGSNDYMTITPVIVQSGVFHSSKQKDKDYWDQLNAVFEAVIPKGAKYMEGVNYLCSEMLDNKPGYISTHLKLIKRLK